MASREIEAKIFEALKIKPARDFEQGSCRYNGNLDECILEKRVAECPELEWQDEDEKCSDAQICYLKIGETEIGIDVRSNMIYID